MHRRRIDTCLNCQEESEIAAHGLCFKCYRHEKRAERAESDRRDPHNPGLRKEHKRIFKAHSAIMSALADLRVSRGDILRINAILSVYVQPVDDYMTLKEPLPDVNGEGLPNTKHEPEAPTSNLRLGKTS